MSKSYYLAYGSNLNLKDMAKRCPDAVLYGTARLDDYELVFRGEEGKVYLNIEEKAGTEVPVAVWQVEPRDEVELDLYEDYPSLYTKQNFFLPVKLFATSEIKALEVFAYVMAKEQKIGLPSRQYFDTCLKGYSDLGFDSTILEEAYAKAKKKKGL